MKMNRSKSFFSASFQALTGHTPLRWQIRLFKKMLAGTIPSACDLPTGLGKTSVIPVWLIALLSQDRSSGGQPLPRRLVYIVNRRTVVDQATNIVEGIRERLINPSDNRWIKHKETLCDLSRRLRAFSAISGNGNPIGISTLRGELADNEEWKVDPARPAIVIGTIDMIGSKLLFGGYGDGIYNRAHHAGLIGQDVLIIHDEAHLTPAFSDLLRGVENAQQQNSEPRPIWVMELSATRRNGNDKKGVFHLESEDEKDMFVTDRLDAEKCLRLHEVPEEKIVEKMVELARQHDKSPSKVLIYVRSPEYAQRVAEKLKKECKDGTDDRIALLTGTIRGYERDQLIRNPPTSAAGRIVRLFLDGVTPKHTVYLLSTSAGEVGIDLDADHMVSDLSTLDSLIQRLGRVNRRGGKKRVAQVDVVAGTKKKKEKEEKTPSGIEQAIQNTNRILSRWKKESRAEINVSLRKLHGFMEKLSNDKLTSAFSPMPSVPPLTDILLDAWSLTSIGELPGRPGVAEYLHGLTHDPPETYVAWRKEVMILKKFKIEFESLSTWFRACRIRTHERLRDRTDRVKEELSEILKINRRYQNDESFDFPVVVLNEHGDAIWSHLAKVIKKDFNLKYKTIVLPIEVCGLDEHGMLNAEDKEPVKDVAEELTSRGNRRERWLHIQTVDRERFERILTGEAAESTSQDMREQDRIILSQPPEGAEDESESRDLMLLASPGESALENPEMTKMKQLLEEHSRRISEHAEQIAELLGLDESLKNTVVTAAKWHDQGKARMVWQRYAKNPNGNPPLAKSTKYLHPRALGGYRHEFGSLLGALSDIELMKHPERELVLHLVAAHHGHGRPHFDPKAFDHERFDTLTNENAAVEVMRRFGQLQQRFGRWGLTWLESLVRCADIVASKEKSS